MSAERPKVRDAMDQMRGHLVREGVPDRQAKEIARDAALRFDGDRTTQTRGQKLRKD